MSFIRVSALLIAASWCAIATAASVVFEDRREGAGVEFVHQTGRTGEKFLIETMGGGVGLFDYDADGLLDIFFVNSGGITQRENGSMNVDRSHPRYTNRLYRNQGDGTFQDMTEKAGLSGEGHHGYGMGVATADFNNDGFVDLYVTHFGPNVLYRNRGDGTFENVTSKAGVAAGGWSVSAGFVDYDNDGDLDLFVVRYLDWEFSKHIRCGDEIQVYCSPKRFQPVANRLYRNEGDGTFTDVSQASGIGRVLGKSLGVAFNDYDGDGWTDIAVANDSVGQMLFHNRGDGTFSDEALVLGMAYNEDGGSFAGMGIDFNDYNNDGHPDVVITNLAKELYALYRNEKGQMFSYQTRQSKLAGITNFMSGWGTHFFDLDHDGWKDLFVAQSHVLDNVDKMDPSISYTQPPLLARNEGGTFVDVSANAGDVFSQDLAGRGAAFGDLDNDGDIDIVMTVLDEQPRLLYSNATDSAANRLQVKVECEAGNRDALGATVRIRTPDGRTQWGYVTTAGSYSSASDARVHFGIGDAEVVQELDIRWPSGAMQTLENVKGGQILTVTEPTP